MILSLVIQVYNGGDFWRQCWESVTANMDLFDQVFVSIGKSALQEEDAALVRNFPSEKVHLLLQKLPLSAAEHGRNMDSWVASFKPEGHIFFLCHDDIPVREGLLRLRALDPGNDEAVFGPWRFFFNEGDPRELTVREFRRGDGEPLSQDFFGFMLDQQPYLFNVSGVVIPAEIYRHRLFPWHLLSYGGRSECCHLCSPCIKRIHQLETPAVRIRRRNDSEGALMSGESNQFDTLLYLCFAFGMYEDHWTRKFIARSVGYALRMNWRCGLRAWLVVQYRLLKFGVAPGTFLKLWRYLAEIACVRVYNRLSSFRRGRKS